MDARVVLRRAIGDRTEDTRARPCKICGAEAAPFARVDFGKSCVRTLFPLGLYGVDIPYFRCVQCHFTFTPTFDDFTPQQWSEIVYNDEYDIVDPDYRVERPAGNALITEAYLKALGGRPIGLDFGGGAGAAAALLRARGWTYDSVDPFDGEDYISAAGRYNICTAYEVFEHVPDPRAALADIVGRCDPGQLLVLIGTNISDGHVKEDSGLDWWYAAPRNGHISLYSREAMKLLAKSAGLDYFSLGKNLHFLSRHHSSEELLRICVEGKLRRVLSKGKLPSYAAELQHS